MGRTSGGSAGGIDDIVEDTTPQLGGTLDIQANSIAGNGGTAGITISANGEVSMTSQPGVLVHNDTPDNNVTGTGTSATVDFNVEIFDQNADFASDTFTAPVTGRYFVQTVIDMRGLTIAADQALLSIVTSNRTIQVVLLINGGAADWPFTAHMLNGSAIVDMDAADTLTITVSITGEATDVADISGGSTMATFLSVFLLG